MYKKDGYEIERKFLIELPDINLLSMTFKDFKKTEIEQIYLSDKAKTRIRKAVTDENAVYIKTVKKRISDIKRIEKEEEIKESEYALLALRKDENLKIIVKTRYSFSFLSHIIEIDVFPFFKDRAFLEVELKEENEEIILPKEISVIREVTFDKRYTNRALAREIPGDIF